VGIRFIKIAAVYFVVGVCLGMYMSMTHNYTLTSVHVHINLLGWVSLAIIGSIYHLFPNLANTKLAKTHFWLHNIALPIMMVGLAFVVNQNEALVPFVAGGGVVLVISIILFAINIFANLKPQGQAN
jgi:cbb3-type cytochrome oxidase subunit 1